MSVTNVWCGGVTSTGTTIIAKTSATSAKILIADNPELSDGTLSEAVTPTSEDIATFTVSDLDPQTRYWYAVEEDGVLDTENVGRFMTHATVGDPWSFTVAAASCAGGNPDFPGPSSALASDRISNHPVFDTIRRHNPLFFAHLGDLHYYDLGSNLHDIEGGASVANYRTAYDDVLSCERQARLYRAVPINYVWDDHDYGPNDSDGTFTDKANAAQVYRERVPTYELGESSGSIYHSFQVGRVLFVVSDTRYNRSDKDDTDNSSKTMLGSTQISWMDTLLGSTEAEALVWLNPTPWLGLANDTWAGYTNERNQLVQLFGDNGWLDRMICISGDYHGLAMDSGSNAWGGFPVYVWASLDSPPGANAEPSFQYDMGPTKPGNNQWGQLRVVDRGHTIELTGAAMVGSAPWRVHTKTIQTSTSFSTSFPAQQAEVTVEIAPGGDPVDPTTWDWVDITDDVRVADGITISFGRPDEFATTSPTTCSLTIDNSSGDYSPRNPTGTYFGRLGRNTPLRVRWADAGERFVGFVTEWPPRWDKSANNAFVPIKAAGIMRRLSQGEKSVPSPLRRSILGGDIQPISYWPCEDEEGAQHAASALGGLEARIFDDKTLTAPSNAAARPSFGSSLGPAGSSGGLTLPYSYRVQAPIENASATGFSFEVWLSFPDEETSTENTFTVSVLTKGGTYDAIEFTCDPGGTYDLTAGFSYGSGGVLMLESSAFDGPLRGVHHFAISVEQLESGFIGYAKYLDGELIGDGAASTITLGTPVRVTLVNQAHTPNEADIYVGHMAFWDQPLEQFHFVERARAGAGYAGERAADRIARLCFEEGVPYYPVSGGADTVQMGPQPAGSLLNILRDCENADGGILYELAGGLSYIARADRYNVPVALALDVDSGHIADVPQPTDDDQRLRNDVVAQRTGGSAARVRDEESVETEGLYEEQVTVNVYRDSDLIDVAGWRVHLGTVDEMRWPKFMLNLAKNTGLIPDWLNFSLRTNRVTIDQSITQLTGIDVDLVVEGWNEHIGPFDWAVDLNAVPASPWQIGTTTQAPRVVGTAKHLVNAVSITVPLPDGWEAGQLALVVVSMNSDEAEMTPPEGWTALDSAPKDIGSMSVGVWWRVLQSGDSDPTFDFNGDQQKAAGVSVTVAGAHPEDPIGDTGPGSRSSSSSDVATTTVTTTEDNQRVLVFVAEKSSTATEFTATPTSVALINSQWGTGGGACSAAAFHRLVDEADDVAAMTFTYDTSSGSGYAIAVVINPGDVDAADRLDTDGSVLVSDVDNDDTTMVVRTLGDAPLWTTDDAEFPFNVKVAGEVIKVTDIASPFVDTFTRSESNGWGSADTGEAWSIDAGDADVYSVNGSQGVLSLSDVGTRHFTSCAVGYADLEIVGEFTCPVTATGSHIGGGLLARYTDLNNHYMLQFLFMTTGVIRCTITKRVEGSYTNLATDDRLSYSGSTAVKARFRLVGSELKARVWIPANTDEPADWMLTATDRTFTSGAIGTHSALFTGNTNDTPVQVTYDNFEILNPQTFTVVRSVNGVAKSHSAGEDVRLARPLILGQ